MSFVTGGDDNEEERTPEEIDMGQVRMPCTLQVLRRVDFALAIAFESRNHDAHPLLC